jgi:hypothetical protein
VNRQQFIIRGDARSAMAAAYREAQRYVADGLAVRVTLEALQPTRTVEQNRLFHSVCRDLSQQVDWAGRKLDTEGWKRLLVDAWARESGRLQSSIVPSLDGQSVVAIGLQTRTMRIAELCELTEFAHAWGSERGVQWSPTSMGRADG